MPMRAASPAVIGFGYGVDRYRHGELLVRAAAAMAIPPVTLGWPGGGIGVQSHGSGFRLPRLARDTAAAALGARDAYSDDRYHSARTRGACALFCQGDWLNQRMGDMNRTTEYHQPSSSSRGDQSITSANDHAVVRHRAAGFDVSRRYGAWCATRWLPATACCCGRR